MKKAISIILTLMLVLCFYVPTQALNETTAEFKEEIKNMEHGNGKKPMNTSP